MNDATLTSDESKHVILAVQRCSECPLLPQGAGGAICRGFANCCARIGRKISVSTFRLGCARISR